MKISRLPLLLTILVLGSVLLSACTGGSLVNSWPGLSVRDNMVYLAYQGSLHAINAETGSQVWSFPEKPDAGKPFYAAPAVTDNLIVAGNFGHMIYGLDHNGKQLWAYDTENGNFAGSPLVVDDTILAPSTDNSLYALTLEGTLRWSFETKNALWSTPASDGKSVYLPALDHNLYALNIEDGSLLWKKDLGSALLSAPLLTEDGNLYVGTMSGDLVAVNAADGSILWQTPTGGRVWAAPLLHEETLYIGNSNGSAYAVSAVDGKTLWQQDAGSPIIGGGALVADGVAFPTEGGSLVAYSFEGQKLWNQTVNGKLYTTLVATDDNVVAAVTEGDSLARAFNSNGQPAWTFTAPK